MSRVRGPISEEDKGRSGCNQCPVPGWLRSRGEGVMWERGQEVGSCNDHHPTECWTCVLLICWKPVPVPNMYEQQTASGESCVIYNGEKMETHKRIGSLQLCQRMSRGKMSKIQVTKSLLNKNLILQNKTKTKTPSLHMSGNRYATMLLMALCLWT